MERLAAAGVTPDQVDLVLITHCHQDRNVSTTLRQIAV